MFEFLFLSVPVFLKPISQFIDYFTYYFDQLVECEPVGDLECLPLVSEGTIVLVVAIC